MIFNSLDKLGPRFLFELRESPNTIVTTEDILNALPAFNKENVAGEEDAWNFVVRLILSYKDEDIS